MIDNIELIKPLIKFENDGDFIRVLILKRKKDFTTDKSNHQSVRTIKSYSFYSTEDLEERYDEIKLLAEIFRARVYIYFTVINDKDIPLKMISKLVTNIESGNNKCKYVYDSVIGQINSKQKIWIVDVDEKELSLKETFKTEINLLEPLGDKILAEIPTKSGIHLITKPFRVDLFKYSGILDIQKNNPTILYIPNSLYESNR